MLNENNKESLVVFPTSRAIRSHLGSLKSKNQFLNKDITIAELLQRVVLDKDNKNFCDKNLKILFLKEAISNIDIKQLGLSGDFSTFLKQSDYIFRFFLETANEYIDFDTLLEYDTYTHYSDHIQILKEIHKNYLNILQQNSYTDNILLPSTYKINEEYVEQFSDITIYLEGYLSTFEFKVISDIAKLVQTKIIITFNDYNLKNMELFENLDEELEVDYRYEIDISNNQILDKSPIDKTLNDITISAIPSQIDQIGFIKYHITKMYEKGIQPEDIVVVVPNEQISSILELFDDEHYFNFAMGRGIGKHKIVEVIKLINKILLDFEPKDVQKFNFLGIKEKEFVNIFKDNWNKTVTKEIFDEVLNYLYSFEKDEELLEKLEQLKISLEILLFTHIGTNDNLHIKLKEFIKLFINQLQEISLDDVNGGKITVLGILETRLVEYEGVIVIDFNDDKVPKLSVKDKFISTNIKKLAKLPTTTDRENLQRYYYKRLFDKSKSVAIAYIDDEQNIMSRFVVQLFEDYKSFIVKQNYSNILYKKNPIVSQEKQIELDIDLSQKSWSATSLKTYLTCKRKYYLQYIAGIKDHTISIKPESFEVGSIIHEVLENCAKQKNFDTIFINNQISAFQKDNPYLVLELELWKKKLEKLSRQEESRSKNGIEVFAVEQKFNVEYNGVMLKGAIDRIDKYPDNYYEILDYKTSSSLKIDTLKTYEDTKDFQLEFYYLASRDKMIKSVGYYDLNDSSIKSEVVLQQKIELLDKHLRDLKTTKVDFTCTDDFSSCNFCSFKTICQRDIS